jgi:hypothetical protein
MIRAWGCGMSGSEPELAARLKSIREQARSHRGLKCKHNICVHHRSTVGASLLAKAVCQLKLNCLIRRFREQARSHTGTTAYIR